MLENLQARESGRFQVPDQAWVLNHVLPLLPRSEPPVILAVGGPSGVGKSTLADSICRCLAARGEKALALGMDDFFHGPEARVLLDEWSPSHVRFDDLHRVLEHIRAGAGSVTALCYVRRPTTHLQRRRLDLSGVKVVVFEGLYVLSNETECGRLGAYCDAGIYLDAPPHLLKQWRFQQEADKPRGRDLPAMEKHWREGIQPDTRLRVAPSKQFADLVLEKNESHEVCIRKQNPRP